MQQFLGALAITTLTALIALMPFASNKQYFMKALAWCIIAAGGVVFVMEMTQHAAMATGTSVGGFIAILSAVAIRMTSAKQDRRNGIQPTFGPTHTTK